MDVQQEIREFVRLQTALLAVLGAERGSAPLSLYIGTLSPTGRVQLGSETWVYMRHGSGVSFKSSSGCVVDPHKMLDEPEKFDTWRLRCYFGSLGRRGAKLIEKAIGERGLSMDKGIEKLLAILADQGQVLADSGVYRLSDSLLAEPR